MAARQRGVFSLRTNSPLCRALGFTTSVRLPAAVHAWCTAFTVVTVDFPHCRAQLSSPCFVALESTCACASSGLNPRASLAQSEASTAGARFPLRRPRASLLYPVFHIP